MAPTKTDVRWLNPREMKAWRSYIIASRRMLEALDSDLAGFELTMADYEVLAQLSDAPGRKLRMSELAEIAMVSKSRLSHRMRVMEAAGWVKREECPEDRRGYFAVMTDKGFKAIDCNTTRAGLANAARNYRRDAQKQIDKLIDWRPVAKK